MAADSEYLDFKDLWDDFSQAKRYLKNVSETTQKFYQCTWKCFGPYLSHVRIERSKRGPERREQEKQFVKAVKASIIEQQQKKRLAPSSINTYLTGLNAFTKWAWEEGHLADRHTFEDLLVEKKFPEILTPDQVKLFVRHSPTSKSQCRAHMIGVLMLDTGIRIDEALSLKYGDVRLNDATLNIQCGKGRKQRFVPLEFAHLIWPTLII